MVLLVPGRMMRSGAPRTAALSTYRTPRALWLSRGEKSVKLEMRGRRMTAISMGRRTWVFPNRGERLSSSSMSARV